MSTSQREDKVRVVAAALEALEPWLAYAVSGVQSSPQLKQARRESAEKLVSLVEQLEDPGNV